MKKIFLLCLLMFFGLNYNRQNEMSKISKRNVQKKRSDQVD